jgi:SAM-dependent methyltransferase
MSARKDPYEAIADVYDQDVHLQVPREFVRTLRPLVREVRSGPPVLDLGCGSGLVTRDVAALGARVIGVDGSRFMLERARRRCADHASRVELVRADLGALRLRPVHELALGCHDVFNHMPSAAVLRRVFHSIAGTLAPGGALVFDALTEGAFRGLWPDNTHRLEGPGGDLWMECDWDERRRRGTARMIAYVRDASGRYTRHETTLHEYLWTADEIERALRAAGFDAISSRPWTPFAEHAAAPERELWCARLAGSSGVRTSTLRRLGFRPRKGSSSRRRG